MALRTAIVLGPDGGAFPVMARLARFGLCSPQGTGQQWVSWLHIANFCRAVAFLAKADDLSGLVNLCAPHPLPNHDFNALLARCCACRSPAGCSKWGPSRSAPKPSWFSKAARCTPSGCWRRGFSLSTLGVR